MEAPLVMSALQRVSRLRQPPPGLLHHTDRGGQYAAKEYRKIRERCIRGVGAEHTELAVKRSAPMAMFLYSLTVVW